MTIMRSMDRLGVDMFNYEGKDFLITVNHYSNYKCLKELKKNHAEDVIRTIEAWFCSAGLPRAVRSDGGP